MNYAKINRTKVVVYETRMNEGKWNGPQTVRLITLHVTIYRKVCSNRWLHFRSSHSNAFCICNLDKFTWIVSTHASWLSKKSPVCYNKLFFLRYL